LLGEPDRVEKIGTTEIPYPIFLDYILNLGETRYKKGSFDLRDNNGINFADDVAQFVCSISVPKYLLHLPHIVFETPFGEDEVIPLLDRVSERGQTIGEGIQRSQNFLQNYVPKVPGKTRELSPDLLELQAEIDAIRANKKYLDERRSKALPRDDDSDDSIEENFLQPKIHSVEKEVIPRKQLSPPPIEKNPPISECCNSPKSVHETIEKETVNDKKETSPNSKNNKKTEHLLKVESSYNCDSLKDAGDSKSVTYNSNSSAIIKETKEKRVTFLVENNDCSSETSGSVDTVDEDIPTLQKVQEDSSNSDIDTPKLSNLESEQTENPKVALKEDNKDLDCFEETEITAAVELKEKESQVEIQSNLLKEEKVQKMADQEANGNVTAEGQGDEVPEVVERPKKNQTPSEPPVTFREFNHTKDFEDLVRTVVTMLSGEEQDRLREMEDWIIKNEGTWVLAEGFNTFLGRILHDKAVPSETRVAMLRLLAFGAGQDDIVLILHSDRKDHLVMNYAQEFDRLPILEQEAMALFFANLFETNSSSEWLLYISEWTQGNLGLSNIRVTTKVAVNALLGDTPALQDYGSAIMHNLATKEVFDDVCSELAMAILQFFQGKPPEEQVFRCMKALNKFCTIAHRDVPQLVKMIGPEPSKFSGMSARIDTFIESLNARLATVPMF